MEYKGWVTKEQKHKMNDSINKNDFKLLIVYGDDKRYRCLGLNITDVENNKELLLGNVVQSVESLAPDKRI